jgi:predicted amidophosphoribosyltransferase
MFCPVCKDEFRPGFTRCANCGVDLVERLDDRAAPVTEPEKRRESIPIPLLSMVEYCGFVSLDDARQARERLKEEGIRSDILIRETPDDHQEEFWLRVDRDRYRQTQALLGFDEVEPAASGGTFACNVCGTEVAYEERFCPDCGARFEDD